MNFPDSSVDKESTCDAGDPSLIYIYYIHIHIVYIYLLHTYTYNKYIIKYKLILYINACIWNLGRWY